MPDSSYPPVITPVETAWLSVKQRDHRLHKLRVTPWFRGAIAAFQVILFAGCAIVGYAVTVYAAACWIASVV